MSRLYKEFNMGIPGEFIIDLSSVLFISRAANTLEICMAGRESLIIITCSTDEIAAALYKKIWDGIQIAATRDDSH